VETLLALFLFLGLGSGHPSTGAEMVETIEEMPAAVREEAIGMNPEYLVARPAGAATEQEPALLIYLHGGGGVGRDIRRIARNNSALKYWNRQKTQPFIIVAPQCLPEFKWRANSLQVFLEHLEESLEVDSARVYLTGYSMGGYGTWIWAAAFPESFAAVAPVAGGIGEGGPKDISPDLDSWLDSLKGVPTWIFHGGNDRVVPVDRSVTMYRGLIERSHRELGLTIYPGEGHDCFDAFKDPRLYGWMLSHTRRTE